MKNGIVERALEVFNRPDVTILHEELTDEERLALENTIYEPKDTNTNRFNWRYSDISQEIKDEVFARLRVGAEKTIQKMLENQKKTWSYYTDI